MSGTESNTEKLEIEMERIAPLKEAARLKGISVDTLRRHYRHLFVKISPRRLGMRIRDALKTSD